MPVVTSHHRQAVFTNTKQEELITNKKEGKQPG